MALFACHSSGNSAETSTAEAADTVSSDAAGYSITLCGTASSGDACLAFTNDWHKADTLTLAAEPAGEKVNLSLECPISRTDSDFKEVKSCSVVLKNKANDKKLELEGDPATVNVLANAAQGEVKPVTFKAAVSKADADSVLAGECYATIILN